MIAGGGLSGGLSSTIAGGNFWQGFRQGIITSGLNHVSHFVQEKFDRSNYDKLYAQVKKVMGNASEHFSGNPDDMWKLMKQVPILRKLLNQLHGAKVWATILKDHPLSNGHNGMTQENSDGSISIKIFQKKSDTNIHVALTLGHELRHAIGIFKGFETVWRGMIKSSAGNIVRNNYAVHQSEVGAYMWSASYADSQSTYDWNVNQSNSNMRQANELLKMFGN